VDHTDVTERPEMRDEAQVMCYETKVPRPAHRRLPSVCGRAPSTDCLLALRCQNTTTTAAAPDEVDVAAGMQGDHEWWSVDIADSEAVAAATAGTDLTIVLAVVHTHRKTGFDVNARGVFNACKAAAEAGHARLVNTGHARTFHHQLTAAAEAGHRGRGPSSPGTRGRSTTSSRPPRKACPPRPGQTSTPSAKASATRSRGCSVRTPGSTCCARCTAAS
jgi:hypothetical protein